MSVVELLRKLGIELTDVALTALLPDIEKVPSSIHAAMRHSTFAGRQAAAASAGLPGGGYRLRRGSAREFEDLGAAIEMLHTYSLIHDDLPALDNDDLRRGKPTCHVVFGEAIAILAGDALQTRAFEVLADLKCPPQRRCGSSG